MAKYKLHPSSAGSPPGGRNFEEYEPNEITIHMSFDDACMLASGAEMPTACTCEELYGMHLFSKSRDVMQRRWEQDGAEAQEEYARSEQCQNAS